jgi:hypothetical protein
MAVDSQVLDDVLCNLKNSKRSGNLGRRSRRGSIGRESCILDKQFCGGPGVLGLSQQALTWGSAGLPKMLLASFRYIFTPCERCEPTIEKKDFAYTIPRRSWR